LWVPSITKLLLLFSSATASAVRKVLFEMVNAPREITGGDIVGLDLDTDALTAPPLPFVQAPNLTRGRCESSPPPGDPGGGLVVASRPIYHWTESEVPTHA
jgi:hypothetical protein